MRSRCVDAQKAAGFPIAAACQAAGVTRSAYYAWTAGASTQAASERHREEVRLVGEIRRIHARSRGADGSPRVTAELRRRGWSANHKRVERLMRTMASSATGLADAAASPSPMPARRPRRTCWAGCSTPTRLTSPGVGT